MVQGWPSPGGAMQVFVSGSQPRPLAHSAYPIRQASARPGPSTQIMPLSVSHTVVLVQVKPSLVSAQLPPVIGRGPHSPSEQICAPSHSALAPQAPPLEVLVWQLRFE
jgi:hypothetical protein